MGLPTIDTQTTQEATKEIPTPSEHDFPFVISVYTSSGEKVLYTFDPKSTVIYPGELRLIFKGPEIPADDNINIRVMNDSDDS